MEIFIITASLIIASLTGLISRKRPLIEAASIIASLVVFAETIFIALKVAASGIYAPFIFFSVDSPGAIMMLLISLIGLASTVYSVQYLREETKKEIIGLTRVREFFILLDLFVLAMLLAVMTDNPIFAWIFIEATTLSTVFLISFYNKPTTMEAAWKYLIINSVGLLLGFFGTLLYFTSVSKLSSGTISWSKLIETAGGLDPMLAKIAFVFVLIGYGTKVGLAPMHTWLPDAHSKAPAPISALLSGVLLNVALITVLRFKTITDIAAGQMFSQNLLIILGFLSIVIAALINFTQKNYKRLLAYHSIENMGIIALGFGFGGLGVFAAILHMIYHALVKSALFLLSGTIFLKYGSTKIVNVRGVLKSLPVTGILFFIGFFIITGTPPFGMFLTKIFILSAGISTHPVISIISLLFAALLFVGFLEHATDMVFGDKPEDIKAGEMSIWLIVPPLALIILVSYLSFSIPAPLYTLINAATAQLSI